MKTTCLLAAMLVLAANDDAGVRWTFEDAKAGQTPEGWSAEKTGEGPGSVWKVIEDFTVPEGRQVLAQTSSEGPRPLFNLCVLGEMIFTDVDLTVSIRAVSGKIDQGGGAVWRYQDANNYYICRQNPLENNFRIYTVVDGKRTQLASIESKAEAGKWHTIRVTMKGDKIVCSINDKTLEVTDGTITKSGHVGLWTKADAVTHFDNFHPRQPQ